MHVSDGQMSLGAQILEAPCGCNEQGSSTVPGALAELFRALARDDMRPDGGGGVTPTRLREALSRLNPRLGKPPFQYAIAASEQILLYIGLEMTRPAPPTAILLKCSTAKLPVAAIEAKAFA